jgi:hypothetical protein
MKKKYTIAWEKYKCPYQPEDEIAKGDIEKIEESNDYGIDEFLLQEKEKYEQEADLFSKLELPTQPMSVYLTPQGAIPIFEHSSHDKVFDLWVGHTNFTITEQIAKIIECVDGVEILDVFTPYRFRLGFAKLFDSLNVKKNIQDKIYSKLNLNTKI